MNGEAKRSSVVERLIMVRWVVGLIPHGGPIELFVVPAWCTNNSGMSMG